MEITLEEIKNKFDALPEEVRWAAIDSKIDDTIIEIGKLEGLNVSQMGQLALETYAVIVGFTQPENFANSVKISLGLNDEKTKNTIDMINQKILKQIRVKMMAHQSTPATHTTQNKNESTEKNTAVSQNAPISIPAQRLMGSFKMPTANTNHGLNIEKIDASDTQTAKKIDPYRELPE